MAPYTKNQLTDQLVAYQVKKHELNLGGLKDMNQDERENFFENKTKQTWIDKIDGAWIDASVITAGKFSKKSVRVRGFEVVKDEFRMHSNVDIQLPTRGTATSAGYDVYLPCDLKLSPYEHKMVMTDVKAYMQEGEVLMAFPRSSLGFKKGLVLRNTVGIIDADYYSNPSNDGNIGLALHNHSDETIVLKAGERVGQLIFLPFLVADNGNTDAERLGGFGSTGTN